MFLNMDNYMRIVKLCILALAIIAQACDQNDTDTTELEGAWSSICIEGFPDLGFDLFDTTSHKVITTYQGRSINTQVEAYTDTGCSTLESTVNASESDLFINPDNVPVKFTIGKQTTSANGVAVREIDFFTETNEALPNIYLLQDNGNTLYFGIPCIVTTTTCNNNRATEIMYDLPYTKR